MAAFAIVIIAIAASHDGTPGGSSRRTSVLLNDESSAGSPSSVMRCSFRPMRSALPRSWRTAERAFAKTPSSKIPGDQSTFVSRRM